MDILFCKGVSASVKSMDVHHSVEILCPLHTLNDGRVVLNVSVDVSNDSIRETTDNLSMLPLIGSITLQVDESFTVESLESQMDALFQSADLSSEISKFNDTATSLNSAISTLTDLLSSDLLSGILQDALQECSAGLQAFNQNFKSFETAINTLSKKSSDISDKCDTFDGIVKSIQTLSDHFTNEFQNIVSEQITTLCNHLDSEQTEFSNLFDKARGQINSDMRGEVSATTNLFTNFNEMITRTVTELANAQKSFSEAADTLYSRIVDVSNTAVEQIRTGVLQEVEATSVTRSLSECLDDFKLLINGVSSLSIDLMTISQCTPTVVSAVNNLVKGIETNSSMVCETGKLQTKVDELFNNLSQLSTAFETAITHITRDSLITSISNVCSSGASIVMEGVRTANIRSRSGPMNSVL